MLTFDFQTSSFMLDGLRIGSGMALADLKDDVRGHTQDIPGQPGWSSFKTRDLPINISLSFKDGCLHSGFFWANIVGGGWGNLEETEGRRRAEHERIMTRLFGKDMFEDDDLKSYLVRDPRSSMEEIFFETGKSRF